MASRIALWASLILLAAGPGASTALAVPKTLGYTFYVDGEPVGRADIRVTQTPEALTFDSNTRVMTGLSVIALTAHTVADPRTYAIRDFTLEGTKGEHRINCEVHVDGDSVYGFFDNGAGPQGKSLKLRYPQTVVFEDWLMELEVLMSLAQTKSARASDSYGMVFASSFLPTDVLMGYAGDVLVEAGSRSMAARKLIISIRGAEPFESHVDPFKGVPVYIQFPVTRAEAFLDEVFGENPVSHFIPKKK
jgi:hypothetical protein